MFKLEGCNNGSESSDGDHLNDEILLIEGVKKMAFNRAHCLLYFIDNTALEVAKQQTGWVEDFLPFSPGSAAEKCLKAVFHWDHFESQKKSDIPHEVRCLACEFSDKKVYYRKWEVIDQ